jgi:pimeloyl-ACP methyl ester carboxylesterase
MMQQGEAMTPALEWQVRGEAFRTPGGRTLSLAVHEGGARKDTTVFLCHGAGGSKNQWRVQWRALIDAGYRVVAWDYPGHGEAPRSWRAATFDGEGFVADYLALFDRFHGDRNILAGHSYGTRLTLRVLCALQAEGRLPLVESAFLIGAPPPLPSLGLGPIVTTPLIILMLMRAKLDEAFVKMAWAPKTDRALVAWENRQVQRNTLFMMKSLMTRSARLDAEALKGLDLPIEILAGADDGVTPPAAGQALAELLPGARFETLADCGHQIMLEQPAATTARLLSLAEGNRA